LGFPVEEDTLLFAPTFQDSTLNWLNQTPTAEEEDDFRKALLHSQFKLGVSKNWAIESIRTSSLLTVRSGE
jgi:hypothetical protein